MGKIWRKITKYGDKFFIKKSLHGGTNVLGQYFRGDVLHED